MRTFIWLSSRFPLFSQYVSTLFPNTESFFQRGYYRGIFPYQRNLSKGLFQWIFPRDFSKVIFPRDFSRRNFSRGFFQTQFFQGTFPCLPVLLKIRRNNPISPEKILRKNLIPPGKILWKNPM